MVHQEVLYMISWFEGDGMETVIIGTYKILAKLLSVPAELYIDRKLIDYGITGLILAVGLVLLLLALKKSYKAPVKHLFGWGLGLLILGFYAMDSSEVLPETFFHRYMIYGIGMFSLLMLMFLIENFIVGWDKGIDTIMIWLGDVFLTIFAMRIWYQCSNLGKESFHYEKLYMAGKVLKKYSEYLTAHNYQSVIYIGKWFCILALLAFCAFVLGKVNKEISGDYKSILYTLEVSTFIYMVFQVHEGSRWSSFYQGVVFGFAAIAQCSLIFLMVFLPKAMIGGKDVKPMMIVKRVILMLEVFAAAVCMHLAAAFGKEIVDAGTVKKLLDPMAGGMTWLYNRLKELHFGYKTNFLRTPFRIAVGFLVTAFLIYLVVLFLFFLLKIAMGDLKCEGVKLPWLRNCILVLVIPVGLYWFYSVCAKSLGESGVWISALMELIALLGLIALIGNFIPAIKKKNVLSLVKWSLVSMVVCLLAVFALLPLLMVFA